MPWVSLPPDELRHLPLFGYDLIRDDGDFAWYRGPRGRVRVEKSDPRVWFDDVEDALQLNAKEIALALDKAERSPQQHQLQYRQ